MKVGVLGHRGVGKSTVFAALTGFDFDGAPGGRRRAVADVADRRLDHLRSVFRPKRFTRARFEIEESPPLPEAETKGRGAIISDLREPDALLLVIGTFEQAKMVLGGSLQDAAAQLRSLHQDLLLLDMEAVEQRVDRLRSRMERGAGDRVQIVRELSVLDGVLGQLESESPLQLSGDHDRLRVRAELRLFADKPLIPVFNVDETLDVSGAEAQAMLALADRAAVLCAPVEREISQIEGDDRRAFLDAYGLDDPASERLTRLAYDALDLISFFTVGEDEVRAWPIRRGSDAVAAAGRIHTDLARGFIRAEVTPYARVSSVANAGEFKRVGAAELKGKDYIVQDGDSVNIRFSV